MFDWLYAKDLVDAGKTQQQVANLKAQIDAAHKALQARLAVERERELNPGGVRDDDGFKRPDQRAGDILRDGKAHLLERKRHRRYDLGSQRA